MASGSGNLSTTQSTKKSLISAFILLFMLGVTSGFLGGYFGSTLRSNGPATTEQAKKQVIDQSTLIGDLAKKVGPSVVSIEVTSTTTTNDFFFGSRSGVSQSAGTGFFVSQDGYILTNRHVIPEGATKVSVTMSDGTKLSDVTVVGRTKSNDPLDIAFLKVNDKSKKFTPVTTGDSSKMEVGNMVIAIGNALGQFQNTVTSGIVSGFGRDLQANGDGGSVETLQNLIQTDAAINQGNSGGPLVNVNGEVIGINTAIAGDGAQNIGFAIPINDVRSILDGVLTNGKIQRPYLGVRYVQLNAETAQSLNIKQTEGAYVSGSNGQSAVIVGSPAEKAGIKEGDIILEIDGKKVTTSNTLSAIINQHKVGDKVTIKILRGDKQDNLTATLQQLP
jgi:serine protease Do